MKRVLAALMALVTLAWGWEVLVAPAVPGTSLAWTIRQEGLNLTGLLSIALMSMAMVLATRPAWLERPLGGLDRIYRLHKWSGILAVAMAAVHWLIQMSSDLLKSWVGREGRLPKVTFDGFLEVLRRLAQDMGEWGIYLLLAMMVLTLWKRLPYQVWRHLHKAMPVIYLMLALHAALLAPPVYWQRPLGLLLGLLLASGSLAALLSLAGRIGKRRNVAGHIESVEACADGVTTVNCRSGANWPGHRAGQFAFITFDAAEGQHPFTIASADRGDGSLTFQIKALGDYTKDLANRLRAGQAVQIEGPYGRFDMQRRDTGARQIWVAGGIGVTPFLAWLEALQRQPHLPLHAEMHYCTRDRAKDPFVHRLQSLCASLPGVSLQVHGALQGETLRVDTLSAGSNGSGRAEVWFCGPQGLGASLAAGLNRAWPGRLRFHQEAFEMR